MKINDDHMFHGAALVQIAEFGQATSIKPFIYKRKVSRSAFVINGKTADYLKFRREASGSGEYSFQFTMHNRGELRQLAVKYKRRLFIGLICVDAREICCIAYDDFQRMVNARRIAVGRDEKEITMGASLRPGGRFEVGVNEPGRRGRYEDGQNVPRSDFPRSLFD